MSVDPTEKRASSWQTIAFLLGGPQFCDLTLAPDEMFVMGTNDVEGCYHQPDVSSERAVRTPMGRPVPASEVARFSEGKR